MIRRRQWFTTLLLAAAGGYAVTATAAGPSALILPGQPFESAQPRIDTTSKGDAEDSSGLLGGHFNVQSNLLRTYTDNMYYTPSGDPNKTQAWGWALQPSINYKNDLPRLQLTGSADGSLGSYNTPGQHDDYADGSFAAGAHWAPLLRDHINLDLGYQLGHDPFGTSRTEGTTVINTMSPDKWLQGSATLDWLHSSTLSGFGYELKGRYIERTYTNNKAFTGYLNYNLMVGEGLAYYAFSPKTSFLLDLIGTHVDTPNTPAGAPDRSGNEYEALGGVRWLATAKTSGDFRVGVFRRTFDNSSQNSYTGVDWKGSITWMPRTYRVFVLETGERNDQSYVGQAGFIDVRYVQTQWMEDWTPRFYTRLVGNYVNSKFVNFNRTDDNYFGALFLNYQLTRNFSIFGIGAFGRRNSEVTAVDYSRADAFVGIKYLMFAN